MFPVGWIWFGEAGGEEGVSVDEGDVWREDLFLVSELSSIKFNSLDELPDWSPERVFDPWMILPADETVGLSVYPADEGTSTLSTMSSFKEHIMPWLWFLLNL